MYILSESPNLGCKKQRNLPNNSIHNQEKSGFLLGLWDQIIGLLVPAMKWDKMQLVVVKQKYIDIYIYWFIRYTYNQNI